MITSSIELITPDLARCYLGMADAEHKNRNIRQRVVDAYARDMRLGNWKLTHQGIAFDEDGLLRDGQHRLSAIVAANCPIQMMVTRGISSGSYSGIDEGVKRSFHDAVNFNDDYRNDVIITQTVTSSTIRALVRMGYNVNTQLTSSEILKIYEAKKPFVGAIYRCALTRKGCSKNANVNAAGLAALMCGEPEEMIYKFFSCYYRADISGCEGLNIQAALLWSKQISDSAARHATLDRKRLYSGSQNAIWNFCHMESTKLVRATKIDRYPVKDAIHKILYEEAPHA